MTMHMRKVMIPLVIICVCVVMAVSQHAYATFTAAVTADANTFGTGTAFMTAKASDNSTLCSSVPAGTTIPATANFTCTGSLGPATTTATQTTVVTSLVGSGTVGFSSAAIKALSCAPLGFTNSLRASSMLARGGITWQTAGPFGANGSFTVNGSDALASGVVSGTGLQTFSVGIWFNTSTKQGALAGWSNGTSQNNDTTRDRALYLDANGYLNWGTYGNSAYQVATGSTNVADGTWHYALGTAATDGTNSVINLYVDGALAATKSFAGSTSAQAGTGYWRAGQSAVSGGSWGGNGSYFAGSLANLTVFPSALSAANVSSLSTAGAQSAYASRAQALGATDLWTFSDGKTTTGTLPSGTAPCAHFNVTFGGITAPYSSAIGASLAITAASPGVTTNLSLGTARNASYASAFDTGLHMLIPVSITETGFTQTFTWSTMETML